MKELTKLCALCNGLYKITIYCPRCNQEMHDLGLLQDFFGPYSAYEDQEIYEDGYKGYTEDCCVHLLGCNFCGWQEYRRMKRLEKEIVTN